MICVIPIFIVIKIIYLWLTNYLKFKTMWSIFIYLMQVKKMVKDYNLEMEIYHKYNFPEYGGDRMCEHGARMKFMPLSALTKVSYG